MSGNVVSIHDAAPVPPIEPAGDGGQGDGGTGKKGGAPPQGLPEGCPVTPLGMSADGKLFFYLDAGDRLVINQGKDHSRLGITTLFNERYTVLMEYWPRLTKVTDKTTGETDFQVTGWKPERAAEELIAACGRKGTINIADRVRGPGAWRGPATERDPHGELILHCGDRVLFGGKWHKPGEIAGRIYPAHARTPLPSEQIAPGGSAGPAADALELFRAWQWKRPDIGPHLLLGALGAAKLGGALKWRPTMWVTGDFGSGKSTLLEYFAGLCGEGGVNITVDATPAGVWQRTQYSSHPVLIDEAEAENDPRKMSGMIKLARAASSGGVVWRGGSEHSAVQFIIQGCFVFGSILVPGLTPQDRSRITVLDLDDLTGIKPPAITAAKLKAMGEALTRRMVDGWPRLQDVFERYREALTNSGHRGRSADQYGILLASAHLLLHDDAEPESDYLDLWCERLPPERDAVRDHENCLAHLVTAPIEPFRGGGRKTVAQWIEAALDAEDATQPAEANKALETYGLSVAVDYPMTMPSGAVLRPSWLYVANSHRGLAQLFEGSHWAGQSGTTSPWVQALRRVRSAEWHEPAPDGGPPKPIQRRFAGFKARATRLPLPLDYLQRGGEAPE